MAGESNLMANMYVPTGPAVVVPTSTRDQWCIECQAYHDPMMAHMFTEALIPVQQQRPYLPPFQAPSIAAPTPPVPLPLIEAGWGGNYKRRGPRWGDPFWNGYFAGTWEEWDEASGMLAMAIWIFVIIMVLFMIMFGGPRYY